MTRPDVLQRAFKLENARKKGAEHPRLARPVEADLWKIGGEAGDHVTAWSWLGDAREAPDEARTLPSGKLTAAWIERVLLDFVGKVLERPRPSSWTDTSISTPASGSGTSSKPP
jgi:hypothetical protein